MSELTSQYLPAFHAALMQMGVSLVVTTYQANQVIILRANEDEINTHYLPIERPMGIAVDGHKLSLATGPHIIEYWNMPKSVLEEDQDQSAQTYDSVYLPRQMHIVGGIDTHEMAYGNDDKLWFVNTRMSCLCTLDRRYSVVPQWRPPFISAYDTTDRCHLNGLAMKDGAPAYLSALGRSDQGGGWRLSRSDGGIIMEYPTGDVVYEGLSMPHSPRWHEEKLWVLESGKGALCQIDLETGQKHTIAKLEGFTRGLAFFGRYAFVGLSKVRDTNIFGGLEITKRGQDRYCGIALVDTHESAVIGYLLFDGSNVQEVFDVSIMPARYPEIVSQSDDMVRTLFSLPEKELPFVAQPDPLREQLSQATRAYSRGKIPEAIELLEKILESDQTHDDARILYANALNAKGDFSAALAQSKNLTNSDASQALYWKMLGDFNCNDNNIPAAQTAYRQALELDGEFTAAHVALGASYLGEQDYEQGWQNLARKKDRQPGRMLTIEAPVWQGQALEDDQVLLLVADTDDTQTLLNARFLTHLKQRNIKAELIASPELMPILAQHQAGYKVMSWSAAPPHNRYAFYCDLSDLPLLLKADQQMLQHCPAEWAVEQSIEQSNEQTNEQTNEQAAESSVLASAEPTKQPTLKVGLVGLDPADPAQRFTPATFAPLFKLANVECINLQPRLPQAMQEIYEQAGVTTVDIQSPIDYEAYRALFQQLDVVIAPDVPWLHLAAAMATPTILLKPIHYNWLWQPANARLWYPRISLFNSSTEMIDDSIRQISQHLMSDKAVTQDYPLPSCSAAA